MQPSLREYPLSALEQRMTEDLEWALTADEVQRHEGQLVVVRNKRIVAVGADQNFLLAQAAALEQCPEDELVVLDVPRTSLEEFPR